MLSSNTHSPMTLAHAPSPVFSKWAIDSNSTGFVDEAELRAVTAKEEPINSIKLAVHSAQVDAYSPCEDKVYVNRDDNLFAVFDGHGGDICSRYIADKLPRQLLCSLKKRKPVLESDYISMFKSTFIQTDNDFLTEHKYVVKTCPAGSCGVSVLMRNDTLYVCNLGDSRVLLGSKSNKRSHTLLTNDHNTKNEKERELVKQRTSDPFPIRGHLINKVEGDRVGGVLMVTRAFGDGIFKRRDMSLPPLNKYLPYITNEPEVTIHKIVPTDDYVVISSDGLYEYFTPEMVAEIVESHLDAGLDPAKIPNILIEKQFEHIGKLVKKTSDQVKAAPSRKSFMDDTSIIILVFQHPTTATTPDMPSSSSPVVVGGTGGASE